MECLFLCLFDKNISSKFVLIMMIFFEFFRVNFGLYEVVGWVFEDLGDDVLDLEDVEEFKFVVVFFCLIDDLLKFFVSCWIVC